MLLLFNEKDDVSYEEIQESTKIGEHLTKDFFVLTKLNFNRPSISDESELKRTLQSLACGKVPILTKNTKVTSSV